MKADYQIDIFMSLKCNRNIVTEVCLEYATEKSHDEMKKKSAAYTTRALTLSFKTNTIYVVIIVCHSTFA